MIGILAILSLIAFGSVYTALNPIYLPSYFLNSLEMVIVQLYAFDYLFPFMTLFKVFGWLVFALFLKISYKIIIGVFALASGAGKPDID